MIENGLNLSINEDENIHFKKSSDSTWYTYPLDYVFIIDEDGINVYEEHDPIDILYCFDGNVKWNWTPENEELGKYHILDFDGNIYVKTGKWYNKSGALVSLGLDGTVYVCDEGDLYALGEKQEKPWMNPLLWGGVGVVIVAGVAIYWYWKRGGEQEEIEKREDKSL
ncbi:MAG: hypothetical protein R6U61_04635 [Thermoplasmata archaeon]